MARRISAKASQLPVARWVFRLVEMLRWAVQSAPAAKVTANENSVASQSQIASDGAVAIQAGGDVTFVANYMLLSGSDAAEVSTDVAGSGNGLDENAAIAAIQALAAASSALVNWERVLPTGYWFERPEQSELSDRFRLPCSTTVLLGDPGSGKSALLSSLAARLIQDDASVLAIKADFLSPSIASERDLQLELQLPEKPSDVLLGLSKTRSVYVLIDQLDALASQADLKSGRLNVLLNLVRRIGRMPNIHIVLSARKFEFNHDVRLRAIDAESLVLSLPPWDEVRDQIAGLGVNADTWPNDAKEVVRSPQALKTFMALAAEGLQSPFLTYQSMLELLWTECLAKSNQAAELTRLASDLAEKMAEDEVLWLAASRFDERVSLLRLLASKGFVSFSADGKSVAFSHQTIFEYILARAFVRQCGSLATYVTNRQESLFVRSKVWSALTYLRSAEPESYRQEFCAIWALAGLRKHLRLMLIEFLGQCAPPISFEKALMSEMLGSLEFRIFAVKAIVPGTDWFAEFAETHVRSIMLGSDAEAAQAANLLARSWTADSAKVIQLLGDCWLGSAHRDHHLWSVLGECPLWTPEVERIAEAILRRTPISSWHIERVVLSVAADQPDVANRILLAALASRLGEARHSPIPAEPNFSSDEEELIWRMSNNPLKPFVALLEAEEWREVPALAEANPRSFIAHVWRWYLEAFDAVIERSRAWGPMYLFQAGSCLELDPPADGADRSLREKPLLLAIEIAVERLASAEPAVFLEWVDANSGKEVMAVQQLIARGFKAAAQILSSEALSWLVADSRRLQLRSIYGNARDSVDLVRSCADGWSPEEISRFESFVLAYSPEVPESLQDAEQRRSFARRIRAVRRDLLEAVSEERLSAECAELVAAERRALGDRFFAPFMESGGGFIGPPMSSLAMARARDQDILRMLREVPDETGWDHPIDRMRGGSIQLSRAFSEFAVVSPDRAIRLMESFEAGKQERPAGYALNAMAKSTANDGVVLNSITALNSRGFSSSCYRESAAQAIECIANRRNDLGDEIVEFLVEWLRSSPVNADEEGADETPANEDGGAILWGNGAIRVLPTGAYTYLSALDSVLSGRGEAGEAIFIDILHEHLGRCRSRELWSAVLARLSSSINAKSGAWQDLVRQLFAGVAQLAETSEAVVFLAHAIRWNAPLVLETIESWADSRSKFARQAHGELVGLAGIGHGLSDWQPELEKLLASGSPEGRQGVAHSAANLWAMPKCRSRSAGAISELLRRPDDRTVKAVLDVFRLVDSLPPDESTKSLLINIVEDHVSLSGQHSTYMVDRLQVLLPHHAENVAALAMKLVRSWRDDLADLSKGIASAAPGLADVAITVHRLGGALRFTGVQIFEAMLEVDAYGARDTLLEIDGRFDGPRVAVRRRLSRRGRPVRRP